MRKQIGYLFSDPSNYVALIAASAVTACVMSDTACGYIMREVAKLVASAVYNAIINTF